MRLKSILMLLGNHGQRVLASYSLVTIMVLMAAWVLGGSRLGIQTLMEAQLPCEIKMRLMHMVQMQLTTRLDSGRFSLAHIHGCMCIRLQLLRRQHLRFIRTEHFLTQQTTYHLLLY